MRCSPDAIKKGYRKALKDNYAFQIASSHYGSKVALSGFNKDTSSNFALFFAENDFNFTKINFPENIVYGGGVIFDTYSDTVFFDVRGKQVGSVWKTKIPFNTKPEKIFEFNDLLSYFYPLKNGDFLFIGRSYASDRGNGWDWFLYSKAKKFQQLSDKKHYYFPPPFMISDSIAGFALRHLGIDNSQGQLGGERGKTYLDYIVLNKNESAERALARLSHFVSITKSKSEPEIQCDAQGATCLVANVISGKEGFEDEIFALDDTGDRQIDLRLKRIERLNVSGDGNHLFMVGRSSVRSNEYFLDKYSKDESGNFVFIQSKKIDFFD